MAETEAPTEAVFEEIQHRAHESHHSGDSWISSVALSSAVFAVLAAVGALLSNHHANEAMIKQIQASNQWNYYQAKGIKANLLATKLDLLKSLNAKSSKIEQVKVTEYKKEQEEISEVAREKETESESHLDHHVVLAKSVTLFQVAIAIAAISILTKRRRFWFLGMGFAAVGLGFLVQGVFLVP